MGLYQTKSFLMALGFLAVLIAPSADAARRCETTFKTTAEIRQALQESIQTWSANAVGLQNQLTSIRTEALAKYERLPSKVKEIFSEDAVLLTLLDTKLPLFHKRLENVFSEIYTAVRSTSSDSQVRSQVQEILRRALHNRAPANSITARIAGASSSFATKESLLSALGFLTLEQSRELLYGSTLSRPTADSLVGQYLAQTGAKKLMRGFPKGPKESEGERRLVLPISNQSFEIYKSLFIDPHFLVHTHSPRQGTLYVSHNGKVGSYANLNSDLREMAVGSLLPHILLSSSEANRAANYFALGGDVNTAQWPWQLQGKDGAYCAMGGYNSCTHWIGNLPIGDRLVDSYSFPGKVDQHAYNNVSDRVQTATLRPHNHPSPLVQTVWSAPGHEQLSDMLGTRGANSRGEYANPGFVFFVLTGQVSPDRVPLVFYWVNDHSAEIPENFDLQVEAY